MLENKKTPSTYKKSPDSWYNLNQPYKKNFKHDKIGQFKFEADCLYSHKYKKKIKTKETLKIVR